MTQPAIDRLSALLERFRVRAQLFHSGALCGLTRFEAREGIGYLHVLRRGRLRVEHGPRSGAPKRLDLDRPTLLFYPRPLDHRFHNPPREGSDFTCAELRFDGGAVHPLVRGLPPLVVVPLAAVPGLGASLDLLFAETDQVRCGRRLLADRLFEVVLIQLLRWMLDHPRETGVDAGLVAGLSDPRIARALTAIHERPGDPWTLERLAATAGLSRTVFAARFRDTVGQTPADYVADWRMALARSALARGRPIKALARELGYASPSALSRVFSARTGQSARAWLRDARDGSDR
jgi:AraC-like DNA-binding protein